MPSPMNPTRPVPPHSTEDPGSDPPSQSYEGDPPPNRLKRGIQRPNGPGLGKKEKDPRETERGSGPARDSSEGIRWVICPPSSKDGVREGQFDPRRRGSRRGTQPRGRTDHFLPERRPEPGDLYETEVLGPPTFNPPGPGEGLREEGQKRRDRHYGVSRHRWTSGVGRRTPGSETRYTGIP